MSAAQSGSSSSRARRGLRLRASARARGRGAASSCASSSVTRRRRTSVTSSRTRRVEVVTVSLVACDDAGDRRAGEQQHRGQEEEHGDDVHADRPERGGDALEERLADHAAVLLAYGTSKSSQRGRRPGRCRASPPRARARATRTGRCSPVRTGRTAGSTGCRTSQRAAGHQSPAAATTCTPPTSHLHAVDRGLPRLAAVPAQPDHEGEEHRRRRPAPRPIRSRWWRSRCGHGLAAPACALALGGWLAAGRGAWSGHGPRPFVKDALKPPWRRASSST